jgi:DNA-binding response OmpR family regulator
MTMNEPAPEAAEGGKRRVLLVDDDEGLRGMLYTALGKAGFEVEQASTGDEAIAAFGRRCPDLLLSDLVLPGPNGQELASRCREICPDAILVFMSGYSEDELHRLNITQVVFIPKPISPKDLVDILNRLLDEESPG